MQTSSVPKYQFRIRTRNGALVDNLTIYGRDEAEARRKLCQMYKDCEVLDCQWLQPSVLGRGGHLNYEDVVDLIVAT